jgi:hypothetical protein
MLKQIVRYLWNFFDSVAILMTRSGATILTSNGGETMSDTYKLHTKSFAKGVDDVFSMRPLVHAFGNVTTKSSAPSSKRNAKKVATVEQRRKTK